MVNRAKIDLNPEKALIFRITHRKNLPWFLDNNINCRKSDSKNPNFVSIGNNDLIEKRHVQSVLVPPGGTLSDYVPFYFTPLSIMLLNIRTGRGGITRVANEDIVTIVTSLHRLIKHKIPFLFTNGHASALGTNFYADLDRLDSIDWAILRAKDFSRDVDDPRKLERYQAEALVHSMLPIAAVMGIGCSCEETASSIKLLVDERKIELPVYLRPGWYF